MKNEKQLTGLKQQVLFFRGLEAAAAIALGLGMYGYFVEDKGELLAFLNESNLPLLLIAVGAITSSLASLRLLSLKKKIKDL